MKRLRIKAVLTTLLILVLLVLAMTGGLLYFGKTGVVWGISRKTLREIHFCASVLMCVIAVLHLALNAKLFLTELRALGKRKDAD